ncbi:MAG: autotransporter domain-containing protein [Candidatus Omnitrophica bacterium]|nr:autotransporter domain-containing protein [Candidatus Omnitrophota bacterium]
MVLLCCTIVPATTLAADNETYLQSVTNAMNHAAAPDGWVPQDDSLITIPGDHSTDSTYGLKYDSGGNLVVRSATQYKGDSSTQWIDDLYVNTPNYVYRPTSDPKWTASWVSTGKDMTKLYDDNKGTPAVTSTNAIKLIERGLGLNNDGTHNAIIEYTVAPTNEYLMRPTKNPDIKTYSKDYTTYGDPASFQNPGDMPNAWANFYGTDGTDGYYAHWKSQAYPASGDPTVNNYPWAQIGYSYFYGNTTNPPTLLSEIKGMTEFIILARTPLNVYGIYATGSYIFTKNKNGSFSTDSDAEFGNGFASFHLTGDCDSIWAGHRFQVGTKTSTSDPNQIIIDNGVTVSGGQGLLVWSLNYDITNHGTFTGNTANKIATTGTDNIAILFKGDTTAYGGIAAPTGSDTLTNASDGSITGTATAIRVEAGKVDITNDGIISSNTDDCISLLGGTNTITNNAAGQIGTTSTGYGVYVESGTASITNSNLIYGTDEAGIGVDGGTVTIVNSGTIQSSYPDTVAAIQLNGGTTTITNTGTIKGITIESDAVLDIGNGSLTLSDGIYTQKTGSTLRMTANSSTDFGNITSTACDAVVNTGSSVYVTVGGYIPNNTTFANVINSTGTTVAVPGTITTSSPVFSFAGSVGAGDHLSLTATRANSYASFATSSNASAAGAALNAIASAGNASGDMLTVLNDLDSLTSSAQINQALSTLTPNVDNSAPQVTQATQDQFVSTVLAHLDGLQNVIDNVTKGLDVWASGFGSYIHQDEMSTSNGYNATIWGTILGFDLPGVDGFRAGISGGFAQDFIRTKDSSSRTDIDSYQGTLYASYSKGPYYIDTAFSFAYNSYDTSRHVALGALDRIATGDYNGQQYSGYIAGGYKFTGKGVELTPIASFLYSHLRLNSYAESGAGALSLNVAGQDFDVAQTGLGMKVGYPVRVKAISSKVTPEFKFKWLYDWVGDAQQATSTFTGGGGSFSTQGFTPAQSSYDFGAKITLESDKNITLSLNYDLEIKEDFYGHYGYGNIRYRF